MVKWLRTQTSEADAAARLGVKCQSQWLQDTRRGRVPSRDQAAASPEGFSLGWQDEREVQSQVQVLASL